MPGLHRTDDRTFVGAFQAIDRAIINPWFMAGGFVGALVFTAGAAVANRHQPAMEWIVAALVLYVIACRHHGGRQRAAQRRASRRRATPTASATWPACATSSTRPAGRRGTSSARVYPLGAFGCLALGARAPRPGDSMTAEHCRGGDIAVASSNRCS